MVNGHVTTRGRVIVREHDAASGGLLRREVIENTTCVGLHEWIVDALDASQSDPPIAEQLALGRSDTSPTSSDTSLNDEVDRVDVTEYADEGTDLRFTFFVGQGEANIDASAGETLSECGVYADDVLLNHALFENTYEKTDQKTMTIEVVLGFATDSGDA